MGYEKGGGPTGGVLEDDTEDTDGTVGVANLGVLDRGGAGPVDGHGGTNVGCAGRGV